MTKVVIINEEVLASIIGPTGAEHRRLAYRVMEETLERASLSEERLGVRCLVPPDPQIVAALGAALIAEEKARAETAEIPAQYVVKKTPEEERRCLVIWEKS